MKWTIFLDLKLLSLVIVTVLASLDFWLIQFDKITDNIKIRKINTSILLMWDTNDFNVFHDRKKGLLFKNINYFKYLKSYATKFLWNNEDF